MRSCLEMSKKLVYNSLSGTFLFVTNIVVAFIMSPILIRALGNRDYGLWELVMSVIGYMGLLDLGIGTALVRFVSVADGRQDTADLQQTISTAFVFFVSVGIVAVLILAGLGAQPNLLAGREVGEIANIGTVLFLLAVNAGFLFPQQVFIATLMGVQRHYFINNVRVVLTLIQAIVLYYLLMRFAGHGLIVLALLTPIFTAIQFFIFSGAVVLDKQIPAIKLGCVKIAKALEMITFAGKSVIMMLASRLQNQSVPIIIGHVIGLSFIVYYVIPSRLVGYAKELTLAIGFPLTPYFGSAIGKGDSDALLKSWLNTSLALQVVSMVLPVVLFFTGESFIRLWLGEEYAVAGRFVLYFLLAGLLADSLATNAFRMLTAQAKHGKCALIWLVLALLSIPVGIWGAYQWGVSGVALGTTMVFVIGHLWTLQMTCGVMQVSLSRYFRETVFKLSLPLLFLIVVLAGLCHIWPITSYLHLVSHVIIAGLVYLLGLWCFTLQGEQRQRIKELVLQKLKRRLA